MAIMKITTIISHYLRLFLLTYIVIKPISATIYNSIELKKQTYVMIEFYGNPQSLMKNNSHFKLIDVTKISKSSRIGKTRKNNPSQANLNTKIALLHDIVNENGTLSNNHIQNIYDSIVFSASAQKSSDKIIIFYPLGKHLPDGLSYQKQEACDLINFLGRSIVYSFSLHSVNINEQIPDQIVKNSQIHSLLYLYHPNLATRLQNFLNEKYVSKNFPSISLKSNVLVPEKNYSCSVAEQLQKSAQLPGNGEHTDSPCHSSDELSFDGQIFQTTTEKLEEKATKLDIESQKGGYNEHDQDIHYNEPKVNSQTLRIDHNAKDICEGKPHSRSTDVCQKNYIETENFPTDMEIFSKQQEPQRYMNRLAEVISLEQQSSQDSYCSGEIDYSDAKDKSQEFDVEVTMKKIKSEIDRELDKAAQQNITSGEKFKEKIQNGNIKDTDAVEAYISTTMKKSHEDHEKVKDNLMKKYEKLAEKYPDQFIECVVYFCQKLSELENKIEETNEGIKFAYHELEKEMDVHDVINPPQKIVNKVNSNPMMIENSSNKKIEKHKTNYKKNTVDYNSNRILECNKIDPVVDLPSPFSDTKERIHSDRIITKTKMDDQDELDDLLMQTVHDITDNPIQDDKTEIFFKNDLNNMNLSSKRSDFIIKPPENSFLGSSNADFDSPNPSIEERDHDVINLAFTEYQGENTEIYFPSVNKDTFEEVAYLENTLESKRPEHYDTIDTNICEKIFKSDSSTQRSHLEQPLGERTCTSVPKRKNTKNHPEKDSDIPFCRFHSLAIMFFMSGLFIF